eukprot:SAG11_NODE_164_length_13880_cov_328.002540_2_plen_684_part_00
MLAKIQPMRMTEEIVVFYKKQCTYNPQMDGEEFHQKRTVKHGGKQEYWGKSPDKNVVTDEGGHKGRYPKTLLQYPIRKGDGAGTRPAELVDFIIKTYSNEGDSVLDITCYDAITGERCLALQRNYLGMDRDPHVENGIEVQPYAESEVDPMTIIDFAIVLNQRLEDKLLGNPIDSRISGLSLCNLDRRADLTSIFVINEILAVEEGAELLFKLALMRCGPNNPAGYRKLIEVIESSYTESELSLDLLAQNLEGYDGPWERSYRRTLMTANAADRAKLILMYKEQADLCWNDLSRSFDGFEVNSTMTYQSVLKMLGGGAKFAAYQISLDFGYKYKQLYDEDKHVLIGPGCEVREDEIHFIKKELQPRVHMKLTQQTIEGLGCEYRKYKAGKPKYKNQSSGNLEEYRAQYEESQRHLEEWNQSFAEPEPEVEKEEFSFAFSDSEDESEEEVASLPLTVSEGRKILLEVFAGTGSVGKQVEKLFPDMRVISIDINSITAGYKPTIVADVLEVDFESLGFVPDYAWFSVPCQTFSRMGAGKHRTVDSMQAKTAEGIKGDELLKKTVEAINILKAQNPQLLFYIENPKGLMRHSSILHGLPPYVRATVSYCHYGFLYQKTTDIFTNHYEFAEVARQCTSATPCDTMVNGRHVEGVRQHPYMTGGPKTLEEKYRIPPNLICEIASFWEL